MKLFLVRHGESIQNTKENYQLGLPDHKVYLSEKGKRQAKEAGHFLQEYIKEQKIDLSQATLWVSPYERTRQFLETIFRDDSNPLAIVSHGTTIRTIIMNWFHYSPEWFHREPNMENGSIRLIDSQNKTSTEQYIHGGPVKRLKK